MIAELRDQKGSELVGKGEEETQVDREVTGKKVS